ncbi:hypothetical protein [Streptomyces sp. NPDC101776]|uniref:hypothetical protein n=1 Tax=Streptomyces sp. NPDC101776 TaxID=3366146 RepID=UPI003801C4DD
MLETALTALAMSGATTIVAAMATDAWQGTRACALRLFRNAGATEEQQAALLAQLDADADLVDSERDDDPGAVRANLAPSWNRRLVALLREQPEAALFLRELVESAATAGGGGRVQNVTVKDRGRAYAAQDGNVIIHYGGTGVEESESST